VDLKAIFTKDGRRERALQKACSKAVNKKLKPEDRRPALEQLASLTSEEAHTALLGRLTFNYDTNMVSDEEEKDFVYETLLSRGAALLPSLRHHLRESPTLSWGLRLLDKICDAETRWTVLQEVLKDYEPGYDRDPSRKIQLITFVGELEDPRAAAVILPYLADHDETVRFTTVEGLLKQGDESAREPLLELLVSPDEESLRIKNRIAEGFVERAWTVKGFRGGVEEALSEDYFVDGKGHVKQKRAKK
jgi:hypothetical protein